MKLLCKMCEVPIVGTTLPKHWEQYHSICEVCSRPAVVEWSDTDEDGDYFYTLRCDEHPKSVYPIRKELAK